MAKPADNKPKTKKSARKSTAVRFGILFFVSVWMFVLGVLVGRGTAPVHFDIESLQKELAALKQAVEQKEQAWYKDRFGTTPGSPSLDFHEALKKNTPESKSDLEFGDSQKPVSIAKRFPVPERKKPVETKPEPADVKPAASTAGPSPVPEPANAEGSLTIQVAALKDAKAADTQVAALIQKGYPAYRSVGTIAGQGTWYRVRVGSFKDKTTAGRMLERLQKENLKGFIVNK